MSPDADGPSAAVTGREIELKLHVDAPLVGEVRAAVIGKQPARRARLQAAYFDTPAHDLAAAGMGWRVRREGRRWVQTLKSQRRASSGFERDEHNVVVAGAARPEPDPTRHDGTDVGDALRGVLDAAGQPVTEQFHTDVARWSRTVQAPGGVVELAFDEGVIASGSDVLNVSELEIELVSGSPRAVIAITRRWAARHHLWLDMSTKAQRGAMLSTGHGELPVVKAPRAQLHADMSLDAALREMTRVCLAQILGNTSALSAGLGGHEHIHQARIGIRKLRTALQVFGKNLAAVEPEWSSDLAEVFAALGASRDRQVVLVDWLAKLAEVGAPDLVLPPEDVHDPTDLLRGVDFTTLMLDLLDYAHGEPAAGGDELLPAVRRQLRRLRRRSVLRADEFAELPAEEQHRVRKELKRLRYVAELTASLFPPKKVERFVKAMAPAQDALGTLNDLNVASALFEEMTKHDARAWFAVGWLSSRRDDTVRACGKPLRAAAKADPYWKR